MLIGHTSQVSFIVATNSHQLEHFVSISDNDGSEKLFDFEFRREFHFVFSEIKLWNNEDGRCIEHIRTNLKHRTVQVNFRRETQPSEKWKVSFFSRDFSRSIIR